MAKYEVSYMGTLQLETTGQVMFSSTAHEHKKSSDSRPFGVFVSGIGNDSAVNLFRALERRGGMRKLFADSARIDIRHSRGEDTSDI